MKDAQTREQRPTLEVDENEDFQKESACPGLHVQVLWFFFSGMYTLGPRLVFPEQTGAGKLASRSWRPNSYEGMDSGSFRASIQDVCMYNTTFSPWKLTWNPEN